MQTKSILKLTSLGFIASALVLLARPTSADHASALRHARGGNSKCMKVSGTLMTTVLESSQTGLRTLGTVTGDLKGAVAARGEFTSPTTARVQHEQVTENGDRILFAPADAVLTPVPNSPYAHVHYVEVAIIGGTGRFAGATGKMIVHGSFDFGGEQTVFRYQGEINYPTAD